MQQEGCAINWGMIWGDRLALSPTLPRQGKGGSVSATEATYDTPGRRGDANDYGLACARHSRPPSRSPPRYAPPQADDRRAPGQLSAEQAPGEAALQIAKKQREGYIDGRDDRAERTLETYPFK